MAMTARPILSVLNYVICHLFLAKPILSVLNDVIVYIQDLNSHLPTRIFMTGYKLSLADVLLYYGLHRYMVGW